MDRAFNLVSGLELTQSDTQVFFLLKQAARENFAL